MVGMRSMLTSLVAVSSLLSLVAVAGCAAEEPADESSDEALTQAPPLGPEPAGPKLKHPVVLAHGFDGSPTNRWGFNGVAEALRADGHPIVHVAAVPPYDGSRVRAQALAQHVDQAIAECKRARGCDATKVNVIAHSMGGIDSRILVSELGYGDKVASLTTISTPHHGSAIADVLLKVMPGSADDAVNSLAKCWAKTFTTDELASQTHLRDALASIAEKNAEQFNRTHPNDARVYYQSWAGVSNVLGIPNWKDDGACDGKFVNYRGRRDVMDATLAAGAGIVAHGTEIRPNDGMVTVESAKWGEFQGCIPADHLDEVGQPGDVGPNRRTGFDHLRFYRNVAFGLARKGF